MELRGQLSASTFINNGLESECVSLPVCGYEEEKICTFVSGIKLQFLLQIYTVEQTVFCEANTFLFYSRNVLYLKISIPLLTYLQHPAT
jgi:hypothetical protein